MKKNFIKECMIEKNKIVVTTMQITDGSSLVTSADRTGKVDTHILVGFNYDDPMWILL